MPQAVPSYSREDVRTRRHYNNRTGSFHLTGANRFAVRALVIVRLCRTIGASPECTEPAH